MTTPPTPTTFSLAEGVVGVFTTRATGNLAHRRPHVPGELHRSRRAVADALEVEVGDLHLMHQVHGGEVGIVGPGTPAGVEVPDVDALATDLAGRALIVQAADCVPILLAADNGPVGVAHAGRGGVAADVAGHLVAALVDLGARPDRLHAAIGPAIGGCCYEVPEAMATEVADRVGASEVNVASRTTWGTPSLDLPAAVSWQLSRAGVADVRPSPGCTRCDPDDRWFSHRRDPASGRHVGAVVRRRSASREVAA